MEINVESSLRDRDRDGILVWEETESVMGLLSVRRGVAYGDEGRLGEIDSSIAFEKSSSPATLDVDKSGTYSVTGSRE